MIEPLPPAQRRRAYLALASATTITVLDGTIANTALPTIARELHVAPALAVWVINGFQLALTMTLFAWSSYAQARGLARIYRSGVAIFTGGSVICALSRSLPFLVGGRMIQGLGAAAVMSTGPALLRLVFPREQLGRALGVNSLVLGTAVAAGPTIGGAILAIAPWPWLFLINVPIGLGIVLLGYHVLPHDPGHRGRLDPPSVVTSAVGFGMLVYGIDGFARHERVEVIALEVAIGVVSFGWFLFRQTRLAQPMFAVDLYGRPLFAFASLAGFLCFCASSLAIVTLPFYFQVVLGETPLVSGLLMTSWPLTMGLMASFAGPLSDRYPAAILSTTGGLTFCLSLALYAMLGPHPSIPEVVLHGAICGFGVGLFQAPNSREMMANAPREKIASAAAVLSANRVTGQTVGTATTALIFALFSASVDMRTAAPSAHFAVPAALWTAAAIAFVAAAASSVRFRYRQPTTAAAA